MKNFQLMGTGVNVAPLLNAVLRNKPLWNANTLRTRYEQSAHHEVEDIWLRFDAETENPDLARLLDGLESVNYPAWAALPDAQDIALNLMRQVRGERLGRVLVTSLAPGKSITAHVDNGKHAAYYERYHVVLQGLPGSIFRCGEEVVQMLTGEVWWFDNAVEHEVINNSAEERVHLIVDIRTCH